MAAKTKPLKCKNPFSCNNVDPKVIITAKITTQKDGTKMAMDFYPLCDLCFDIHWRNLKLKVMP